MALHSTVLRRCKRHRGVYHGDWSSSVRPGFLRVESIAALASHLCVNSPRLHTNIVR